MPKTYVSKDKKDDVTGKKKLENSDRSESEENGGKNYI
jgi:hypothetical protein